MDEYTCISIRPWCRTLDQFDWGYCLMQSAKEPRTAWLGYQTRCTLHRGFVARQLGSPSLFRVSSNHAVLTNLNIPMFRNSCILLLSVQDFTRSPTKQFTVVGPLTFHTRFLSSTLPSLANMINIQNFVWWIWFYVQCLICFKFINSQTSESLVEWYIWWWFLSRRLFWK